MKIFTPQIAWHDRQPILSVDIQNRPHSKSPDSINYRLATGGNDSHVIIWKVSMPNGDNNSETERKKPIDSIECLSELTQHQRSVNIVRFSPNPDDDLLASGDDDSLIFIWKLMPEEEGKTDAKNVENIKDENNDTDNFAEQEIIQIEVWKTFKILRGHNQDVSDLCWSKDGQHLVSGSVDNNVFVWDVYRGVKKHKVAKEHSSYVQGVTWDPLNKYIASLSADRNMIIFNAKNGKTLHRVSKLQIEENSTKLFYDQTLMSFFRRLTFSPGGELLFAPSGILETGPEKFDNVVYIFERKSLNRPSCYLPTNKFSVAVKCCPIMFKLREGEENMFKFPYRIVFAVATQDSVMFYDSQQLSPFAFVSQLHYLRLTDISWSSDGRMLIITSTDGFASFIVFQPDELGIPYDGPLLVFEDLEENKITPTKKLNHLNKSVNKSSEKIAKPQKAAGTPITSFFRKTTKTTTPIKPVVSSPTITSVASVVEPKPGRRVELITLSGPKKIQPQKVLPTPPLLPCPPVDNVGDVENVKIESELPYETGIKRKQYETDQL